MAIQGKKIFNQLEVLGKVCEKNNTILLLESTTNNHQYSESSCNCCCLFVSQMVVADVYNHRFHKVFTLSESLTQILDRDDIFV